MLENSSEKYDLKKNPRFYRVDIVVWGEEEIDRQ